MTMMNTWKSYKFLPIAYLILGGVWLAGCGLVQNSKDAEAVVAHHFQTIATNGFDAAMADYAPRFFEKTSKEDWTRALSRLNGRLGAYQSYTVTSWNIVRNAGTTGSGTTVTLQCDVKYSRHSATEKFTIFKGLSDSGFKIVGHHIDSSALLLE